jgi:hypothetical protein
MRLNEIVDSIPTSLIGGDEELVIEIQHLLTVHGFLDPPADGKFGPVSHWALADFAYRKGLSTGQGLTSLLARALLDTAQQTLPVPAMSNTWFDKVIDYMNRKEYWICRHPKAVNIIYLEGVDPDGSLNDDRPNVFNDLRVVFSLDEAGVPQFQVWEGTTEPGLFWTIHPMNPKGAARIAFDQYKSWAVGVHHAGKPNAHEALIQVAPVLVYRDLNKDFKRTGDKPYSGLFGINQHWGYDASKNDLGLTSAGCLVGRSTSDHKKFMKIVKSDPRYQASSSYRFVSTIMPGDAVLKS